MAISAHRELLLLLNNLNLSVMIAARPFKKEYTWKQHYLFWAYSFSGLF